MKFIVLGYYDDKKWEALSEKEQKTFMEECLAYDDVLRNGGHVVGGEALEPAQNATTIRFKEGRAMITDGPYAETKEQIGGVIFLEARDRKQAIELMSKHPGLRIGPMAIRAQDAEMMAEFEARHKKQKAQ
ncbi:MAG TPA: YciI family protein [Terriglobales bacterium]|jgi:hypothetical protein